MQALAEIRSSSPKRTITNEEISQILEDSRLIVSGDKCYPETLRDELGKVQLVLTDEFVKAVKPLSAVLEKKAECEKFYEAFMSTIPLRANIFFPLLSQNASVLLVLKFADCMITHYKQKLAGPIIAPQFEFCLSDKEKDALQYLAGYVLRNLYKKIRNSNMYWTKESKQALAFIDANKLQQDDAQRLVTTLNRGGLWLASYDLQQVLEVAEKIFQGETIDIENLRKIDWKLMTAMTMQDFDVMANCQLMLEKCAIVVPNHVGKDTLAQMIALFFRVRAFSFSKSVLERQKHSEKKTKSKALRTDIKRSSNKQQNNSCV